MNKVIDARVGLPDPRKDPVGYGNHLFNIAENALVGDYIQTPRSLVQKIGHKIVKTIEKKKGPYPHYRFDNLIISSGYVHPT